MGNDPEVAIMRRISKDVNTNMIYLLSGKQINEAERADVMKTMARMEEPDGNFFENLNDLQAKLAAVLVKLKGQRSGPVSAGSPERPPQHSTSPATHRFVPGKGIVPVVGER